MTTVVVLPGLDGTDVLLRPLLKSLPTTIRVVVVTYPERAPCTHLELLGVAQRAVDGLENFYILAFSFGGPLAVLLAAAEQRRVRGIILVASFLRLPKPQLAYLRFATTAPVFAAFRTVRRLPVWLSRRPTDAWRVAKRELWKRVSASALASRVRSLMQTDVRQLAASCPQDVLCVIFDADRVVPLARANEIITCIPHAQTLTLRGGHFAMFASPTPLAAAITAFLVQCEEATLSRAVLTTP